MPNVISSHDAVPNGTKCTDGCKEGGEVASECRFGELGEHRGPLCRVQRVEDGSSPSAVWYLAVDRLLVVGYCASGEVTCGPTSLSDMIPLPCFGLFWPLPAVALHKICLLMMYIFLDFVIFRLLRKSWAKIRPGFGRHRPTSNPLRREID